MDIGIGFYLAIELGCTAKTSRAPRMFRVHRLCQNREDSGDEVRERPIFGLPHRICPRFSSCIFLLLKFRYLYLGAQNGKKSSRGIMNFSKEDMGLFKATKSRFALRFFRFARDPDLKPVKFALKCKPNHGLQIDCFIRPG